MESRATSEEIALAEFSSEHGIPLPDVQEHWYQIKAEAQRAKRIISEYRQKAREFSKKENAEATPWQEWERACINYICDRYSSFSQEELIEVISTILPYRSAEAILEIVNHKEDAEPVVLSVKTVTGTVVFSNGQRLTDCLVRSINKGGLIITLPNNETGFVPIREIAREFITDLGEYVRIGDKVNVVVLGYANGQYQCSVKEFEPLKKRYAPSTLKISYGEEPTPPLERPDYIQEATTEEPVLTKVIKIIDNLVDELAQLKLLVAQMSEEQRQVAELKKILKNLRL